jgi:hypothetical protein
VEMLMTTLMLLVVGGSTTRKFCTHFPKREAFLYHGYVIYYSEFIFEILQTTHPSESKNQPRIRIFLYLLYHKSNRKDSKKTKRTEIIKNYKKQSQQNKKNKQIED